MTSPDPLALAHAAASALEQLCATVDDCAREVEARGGERAARLSLPVVRSVAVEAMLRFCDAMVAPISAETVRCVVVVAHARVEVEEMIDGAIAGYARRSWALRIVAIGTEVSRG